MKHAFTLILFGGAIFVILFFLIVYPKPAQRDTLRSFATSTVLAYEPHWNVRQSLNACGPYSAANVMRLTGKADISSETISQATPWRYRGYTAPFGLARVLLNHGYSIEERIVDFTDEERIAWLKTKLSQQKPIILLGEKTGFQHYITLTGYSDGIFHVYDPLEEAEEAGYTMDKNGDQPGNIDWDTSQLLSFWQGGGILGLYRYYALTLL